MSDAEIVARLAQVLRTTFRLSDDFPVERTTTAPDVPGWDSLSHTLLVMNVEEAFGIQLPMEDAYGLANIGELTDLVERLRADRA